MYRTADRNPKVRPRRREALHVAVAALLSGATGAEGLQEDARAPATSDSQRPTASSPDSVTSEAAAWLTGRVHDAGSGVSLPGARSS